MEKDTSGFATFPFGWKIAVVLGAVGGWILNNYAGTAAGLPFAIIGAALVVLIKAFIELFFGHFFKD